MPLSNISQTSTALGSRILTGGVGQAVCCAACSTHHLLCTGAVRAAPDNLQPTALLGQQVLQTSLSWAEGS